MEGEPIVTTRRRKLPIKLIIFVSVIIIMGVYNLMVEDENDISLKMQEFYDQGQFQEAIDIGEKFIEKNPNSADVLQMLGWSYSDLDKYDEALDYFYKCLEVNKKMDNAYVGIGAIYRRLGEFETARSNYLKSIEIYEKNPEAYSSLSVIEMMEGNLENAIEYGEKAWSYDKTLAIIPSNLAVAYHYLGNDEKRDEYYDHAERLGYSNLENLKLIFSGELTIY